MIINDLDGYYIVFDTKNWNTELDTLVNGTSINDTTILIPLMKIEPRIFFFTLAERLSPVKKSFNLLIIYFYFC